MQQTVATQDYTSRRGELSAYGRAVNSAIILRRVLLLFGCLVAAVLLLLAWLLDAEILRGRELAFRWIILVALGCVATGLFAVWTYTNRHFIEPDLAFRKWLQQVCDGELDAQIDLPDGHRHFKELNFHTRNLASSLNLLSTDMESLVASQTQRLEYQKRVLELLLNVTSNMSGEFEEQAVLDTVCAHLADWFGDARVTAWMLVNGELSQVAVGQAPDRTAAPASSAKPTTQGKLTHAAIPGIQLVEKIVRFESTGELPHHVRIPVLRNNQVAGVIEVNSAADESVNRQDANRVLTSVAEQLGLFMTKNSAVENAHKSRLLQERANLGAEIHDSLAQTLLATRYHLTLLRESLKDQEPVALYHDVERIEGMIGEANEEVRGLIRVVRKPLATHGYADSLQLAIDQFREKSGMQVFFQLDNPHIRFTPREDSALQRIVTEALTNAQKYSQASMIRVFLRSRDSGFRSLLIEDDGIGFDPVSTESVPGNGGDHIGLSIMQERALSIGAVLSIDSESGEGTRVSLELPPLVSEAN